MRLQYIRKKINYIYLSGFILQDEAFSPSLKCFLSRENCWLGQSGINHLSHSIGEWVSIYTWDPNGINVILEWAGNSIAAIRLILPDGRDFFYSGPTTNSCLPLSWLQRYNLKGFPSMRCGPPLNWLQRFNLKWFPTRRCCSPLRMLPVNIPDMCAYVHSSHPLLVDTRQPLSDLL